jgi:hypothetical protein
MSLLETIIYFYEDKLLMEMANIQPDESGLGHIINIVSKGGAKRGARIKVSNVPGRYAHDDNFVVTLEQEPRIIGNCKLKHDHLDHIKDWVKLNKDHINKVWNDNGSMHNAEIMSGFKKL